MSDSPRLRILVLTRSYPAATDLYQYPFVHRRVLAYRAAGHDVAVFRPTGSPRLESHIFEGVTCFGGGPSAFADFASDWAPDVVAAHGFTEQMWPLLAPLGDSLAVRAWLHGSEIPAFFRAKATAIADPVERSNALEEVRARCEFWTEFLRLKPTRFKLVFVSNSAVGLAREDMGDALGDDDFAVIPNPIDTDLFGYRPKKPDDRLRMLMVRPFDSAAYGNDLAVSAILHLSRRSEFDRLGFTIIGDGPLFEETLKPVLNVPNVYIERRFLTQSEIAAQHQRNGIFLVPTRLDTQGVSRDEAMASGLVPVTNFVSAVPEFVDDSCAALAGPDDAPGLAEALWAMIEKPDLFLSRSAAAAERVRRQSGYRVVIPAELALLAEAAGA